MNVLKFSFYLLSAGILIEGFTACSDDTPDVKSPDVPSAVDEKDWTLNEYVNTDYKPGDNFFMYCNGAWYNSVDMGMNIYNIKGFMYEEVEEYVDQRIKKIDDPTIKKFEHHAQSVNKTTAQAEAAFEANLAIVENITTQDDALNAVASTIARGYDRLLDMIVFPINGKMHLMPYCTYSDSDDNGDSWITNTARRLRHTAPSAAALLDRLKATTPHLKLSLTDGETTAELLKRMRPISSTRSGDEGLMAKISKALGVSMTDIYIDPEMTKYIKELENADPEEIKEILTEEILYDKAFTSDENLAEYNRENETDFKLDDYVNEVKASYMPYIYSYAYAPKYVTPERKQHFLEVCEGMRSAFEERIKAIDWMSQTTKQNAIKKLAAMKFNVGYPDEWIEEGLPELTGETLAEDVLQLRKARRALYKTMVGQKSQDVSFSFIISDVTSGSLPLTISNAFYVAINNSINIYPVFMLEPLYDEKLSDAYNYAVFAVLGHEMTHGFDSSGSLYDEVGSLRNWWTVADKMEFTTRLEKLVTCYGMLELLPDEMPGVYADGEKTLGENIADLGGVKIAYDAYMKRLALDGFTGEEVVKQEKRFFQAYANLWRSRSTPSYADWQLKADKHSASKERINGVVMNIDRWYELFDVTRDNLLYLKSEQRTYIW